MHGELLPELKNEHDTGSAHQGEARMRAVVFLTAAMMIVELIVGAITGSMALLSDGWHMATHVGALGLSAAAYWFARLHAGRRTFTFGPGKVYALAGYTSGMALALVALPVAFESFSRLAHPVNVRFAEALPIAVVGLIVNLVSARLLDADQFPDAHGGHAHGGHAHGGHAHGGHGHGGHGHGAHTDHNLRAAYMHVLADALTSVLAIIALIGGRYLSLPFLDPLMGIVASAVVLHWSWGLCRGAGRTLLDASASVDDEDRLRSALETIDDVRVADLHLWEMGPGRRGCIVSVFTSEPREADFYRERMRSVLPLSHLTVEVHRCAPRAMPSSPSPSSF
jgi:cation diffusion facilitator family transporter